MAHDLSELVEYPARRLDGFPRSVVILSGILVLAGIAAMGFGLLTDPARTWRAYTFNWLDFAGVAFGAVLLGAVVTITRGVWSRPVRRIALSFAAFLPIAFLLFLPLVIWVPGHLFPWIEYPPGGNTSIYLDMPFLIIRNLVLLAALLFVVYRFAYWALRPDIGLMEDLPETYRGLYDRLTRGWRGQEAEEARAHRKLTVLAPIMAILYALALSILVFDFVMSLEVRWFSTLLGPYFFMGAFLGGIALTTFTALLLRSRLGLEDQIGDSNIHDLGKLLFAFCVFWAYLFFSQYIVIWYGNMPHEQIFLVNRLSDPYRSLSIFVFFALFIVPFFSLMGVKPKKTPVFAMTITAVVLFGLWIERYLLIYPTLYPGHDEVLFGIPEIGVGLGFAGIIIAAVTWFMTRFPILQLWQHPSELELLGTVVEYPEEAAP